MLKIKNILAKKGKASVTLLIELENSSFSNKASILAGFAFSQTRTAAAHELSYPLTLYNKIPHGYASSLTLGAIFDYNFSRQPELSQVLKIMRGKYGHSKSSFNDCFQSFLDDCEVPCHVSTKYTSCLFGLDC